MTISTDRLDAIEHAATHAIAHPRTVSTISDPVAFTTEAYRLSLEHHWKRPVELTATSPIEILLTREQCALVPRHSAITTADLTPQEREALDASPGNEVTEPLFYAVWASPTAFQGMPEVPEDALVMAVTGNGPTSEANAWLIAHLDPDTVLELVRVYRQHVTDLAMQEGARFGELMPVDSDRPEDMTAPFESTSIDRRVEDDYAGWASDRADAAAAPLPDEFEDESDAAADERLHFSAMDPNR